MNLWDGLAVIGACVSIAFCGWCVMIAHQTLQQFEEVEHKPLPEVNDIPNWEKLNPVGKMAVEWYIEKLLDLDYEYAKGLMTLAVWSEGKKSLIEQAKEIEKEQREKDFVEGYKYHSTVISGFTFDEISENAAKNGFEKTYGGNK